MSFFPRNQSVDLAKTLGMALVVLGHCSGYGENDLSVGIRNFIYQFHIPLFFFLSGFCFNPSEDWRTFIIKKMRRLYLPFIVSNFIFFGIFIIAHWLAGEKPILIDVVKHSLKLIMGIAVTPLGGATWFLIILLWALVLFKGLQTLLMLANFNHKRDYYLSIWALSAVLGIVGTLYTFPLGFDKAFVALFFVCTGHLTCIFKVYIDKVIRWKYLPILLVSGVVLIFILSLKTHPDLTRHDYGGNPLIYFSSSLTGIFTTFFICSRIADKPIFRKLSDWGKDTLAILIGHFLAFKAVTAIQLIVFQLPWTTLFSHPCYFVGKGWSVLYFLVGFFGPLFLNRLVKSHPCRRPSPL